jgi:hypothetical protein
VFRWTRDFPLVTALVLLVGPVVVFVATPGPSPDPGGWGGLLQGMFLGALLVPVFAVGYVAVLGALLWRRPVRADAVGWIAWGCALFAAYGLVRAGFWFARGTAELASASTGDQILVAILVGAGALGVVVAVVAVVPRRGARRRLRAAGVGSDSEANNRIERTV